MNTWEIEDLSEKLQAKKTQNAIHQYVILEQTQNRIEHYLLKDPISGKPVADQKRSVEKTDLTLKLWVKKANQRLGAGSKPLLRNRPLVEQIESLMKQAEMSDEEYWEIPEVESDQASGQRAPETLYSGFKTDFLGSTNKISKDLSSAILGVSGEFNSAELFFNYLTTKTWASNGFVKEIEQSRIYAEVCFSASGPDQKGQLKSEEFLVTAWAAHPEQLDFRKMCEQSVEGAKGSLKTELPQSGTYDVLVAADVVSELFHNVLWQLDGEQQYKKYPHLKESEEFSKDFSGEPFRLVLDPEVDFGMASGKSSSFGFIQKPMTLLENNKVLNTLFDVKISQYLKRPQTTSSGNLKLEAEGLPADELRMKRGKVLEILQFSGLFVDPMSLTFSSEIRLAKLFDQSSGKVSYVKGGNLSGNIRENMSRVLWSKETQSYGRQQDVNHVEAYSGPAYALLNDVSVSS